MKEKIFALVDVNNCYVSCERAFRPKLNNVPVIVLSNNDGCVIARYEEAKALGIKMAVPYFQIKNLVATHQIEVLSSNYTLYAEMSRRFHGILANFVDIDEHEIYSIDECFLDLSAYATHFDLITYSQTIRTTMTQCLSLPVCVGIGRSKTEAKLANHLAKKQKHYRGVCDLAHMDPTIKEQVLHHIPVGEIWGIGRQHSKKLATHSIHTALDLALANPQKMRKLFSVLMQKTILELQGIACLDIESNQTSKKQIIASRSFGIRVTKLSDLKEATTLYIQDAFRRMRSDHLVCGCIIVFAQSNPFNSMQPFHHQSRTYSFSEPTDSIVDMVKIALSLIESMYQEQVFYKKCGLILTALEAKSTLNGHLLSEPAQKVKQDKLLEVYEYARTKYGAKTLAIGSCMLPERAWMMHREKLSQNYFKPAEFLQVK